MRPFRLLATPLGRYVLRPRENEVNSTLANDDNAPWRTDLSTALISRVTVRLKQPASLSGSLSLFSSRTDHGKGGS